ncbi:hypothetical protein Tco_1452433, partial [Tanacetum coccineum]
MINVQQRNENLEITLNQVIEDAHVKISIVVKKIEVLVTSSSYLFDLASKFLNFLDIPHIDAEIVSPMDVHVHQEVLRNQTHALLIVPVSVISESSPVYTTIIPQSLPSFTPPPPQSTPTPPPTNEETNPLSALLNFASIFQFNNRILPKEVSNFAPPVIKSMVTGSLEHVVLTKESSQPQFIYKAATSLTKFELKKILIDKMDESQSYLTATENRECYDVLIKSYDLDMCTDNANISRERSKPDKHGNGNGIENTRAERMLSK